MCYCAIFAVHIAYKCDGGPRVGTHVLGKPWLPFQFAIQCFIAAPLEVVNHTLLLL